MGGCSKWCPRSNIIFVCNIFGVIIVATCHARDVLNEKKFQRGGSPSPIHCFSVQLNREAQKLVQKFCKIMQSRNFPIFEHSFVAYWSSRLYNMQLFKKGMTSNEMLCWSVLCSSWWQASSLNSMRGGTCHSPLQIVTPPLQNVTPLQIVTPPCKLGLTLTVSLLLSPAWVKIAANFCQHSTLGVLLQCSILGEDIPFLSNWKQKHSSRSVCWWPMAKNCQEY